MMKIAIAEIVVGFLFRILRKQQQERKREMANSRISATQPQPPFQRLMYQMISCGRLPDQVISNCEKFRYAQSMTSASSSLPRSCRCFFVSA